ncbi:hypothetical protein BSPCLSOX_1698, partial [uncultured Gammaproteobacteria bacterium]
VTSKNYPEINDVKPSVKTNLVPNYDIEINAKTNYDGDGFCGFAPKNYPEINDVKPSVKTNFVPNYDIEMDAKTNFVPNYDIEINAKTNYDGDGFCGFAPKNYPEINDAEPLAKTNYDGGSLFDGFIPNYDAKINDTNPLAKTDYDNAILPIGCFAELPLLETIPKVDAKPEAKKNNTTIDIAGKVGFDLNDSFNGTLTEYRPDASDLPNIVMIDNADTPITDFIVM